MEMIQESQKPTPEKGVSRSMLGEEALLTCEALEVRTKQVAYELSYVHLENGPIILTEFEAVLREAVSELSTSESSETEQGQDIFAWKYAAYMAVRWDPADLPRELPGRADIGIPHLCP